MIRKQSTLLALLLAMAALAPMAQAAETYNIDKAHSQVLFTVKHLVSRVTGKFEDFEGKVLIDRAKPENSTAEFSIKTTSVNTSTQRRDDHLRSPDFFDVAKFPEITFKSTKVVAKSKEAFEMDGELSMHGISKPVVLAVTFLGDIKDPQGNERAGFEATTVLNRKDYGIVWNRTLDSGGYLLGDDVSISINLETVKPKPAAEPAK